MCINRLRICSFHQIVILLATIVVSTLSLSDSLKAQERVLVPITAHDNGSGVATDTFGFHPNATYCPDGQIDSDLVEEELPFGIPGIFDFRFVDHRIGGACMGSGLRIHIQEASKIDTFRMRFFPSDAGYPFVFRWPSGLDTSFDFLRIDDVSDGLGTIADMLTDTMLVVTNPMLFKLDIIGALKLVPVGNNPDIIPDKYSLLQNYPNPFNPITTIQYQLPEGNWVSLKLFNLLGEEVKALVNEYQPAGVKSIRLEATDLPSGVYMYRLQAGSYTASKRLVLMK